MRNLERTLIAKLRAWYWHFEVERLALDHFHHDSIMPINVMLKAIYCAFIANIIHFFVKEEELFIEPPEKQRK